MKKVLILTCSTGEGHNSAARALESTLKARGIPCLIQDPVSFQSERMQHAVSSLYNNMIKKTPSVFGAIYKLGDAYAASNLPSPVYWANAQYAAPLKKFILENGFDTVICTHLYGMEVMTAIGKDESFPVSCYGVLTDYVCIPFTGDSDLDGYFVPCPQARDALVRKGIASEKIFLSGIPVDPAFSRRMDQAQARTKLSIPADQKMFLVMTGGVGCENMLGLCHEMTRRLKDDGTIFVLTGKNENLIPADQKMFLVMTGGVGCENMLGLCHEMTRRLKDDGTIFVLTGKNENLKRKLDEKYASEPRIKTCENMLGLCHEMTRRLKDDGTIFVLTGKNENLKRKLDEKYASEPRIKTVAFTREVPVYMAAADVVLSKPGGLSSTEAAVANVPLVHIHAIPGCETYNANYFNDNGIAMLARSDEEAAEFASLLAYDPQRSEQMRQAQRDLIPRYAADTIIEEIARA